MKKAIVFLMMLTVLLMFGFADEKASATNKVEYTFDANEDMVFKLFFAQSEVTTMAAAKTETGKTENFTLTKTEDDETEASGTFYLVWYTFSNANFDVEINVPKMKKTDAETYITFMLDPTITNGDGSKLNNGLSSIEDITVLATDSDGKNNIKVVDVDSTDSTLQQSWGRVNFDGTATVTGAVPGTYSSSITAILKTV